MGAFCNSICLPGDRREAARSILDRWLAMKGFVREESAVLFDLDGDAERSAYLATGGDWTVLFYSHWEEEHRLIHELQATLAPLFYVWVYDSDVWGYDLFDENGFLGSFNSDPKTHQSFPDDPVGAPHRPRIDAEALAQTLGIPEQAGDLRRIERRRTAFKEDNCRELCTALKADAAALSYEDLENGALDDFPAWSLEQVIFARKLKEDLTVDIHTHPVGRRTPGGLLYEETVELPAKVRDELARIRRRSRWTLRILQPLAYLARAWRGIAKRAQSIAQSAAPRPMPRPRPGFRLESAVLVNERHGCRITLASGLLPAAVSSKPSAVFAFKLGPTLVTCTARRLHKVEEVLKKPGRSRVHRDEKYTIADHKVRHLVFELSESLTSDEKSYLVLYVIQTEKALYVFLYRSRRLPAAEHEALIRRTVDSFRIEAAAHGD